MLRFYSPMRVLGGGVVVDPASVKHKRHDTAALDRLERALKGDPALIVEDALKLSETGLAGKEVARITGLTESGVNALLNILVSEGRAVASSGRFMHTATRDMAAARIREAVRTYHNTYPMRPGISKEELRAQIGRKMDQKGFHAMLALMSEAQDLVVSESIVRLPDHKPTLSEEQARLAARIEAEFEAARSNPAPLSDIERQYGPDSREIVAMLVERGDLVRISDDMCLHKTAMESAEKLLRDVPGRERPDNRKSVPGPRRLQPKYAVPLLEYFDSKRLTRRVGDQRVLLRKEIDN